MHGTTMKKEQEYKYNNTQISVLNLHFFSLKKIPDYRSTVPKRVGL